MTYDLIVLGGGPAGYNAAERAAEAGMNTLLYEGKVFYHTTTVKSTTPANQDGKLLAD